MRQDVAEFLRTQRPSLVSIIAREAERSAAVGQPLRERRRRSILLIALTGAGVIATAGIVILYLVTRTPGTSSELPREAAPPQAPLHFEATITRTIPKSRSALREALAALAREPGAEGTITRWVISIREGGTTRPLGAHDVFDTMGGAEPGGFPSSLSAPIQFFSAWRPSGPRLGIIGGAANPARALAALYAGEASLLRDLEILFVGRAPGLRLDPFRDKTYRNVDFRYLELNSGEDLGIGYLVFPSKRLAVITTSEGALRQVIGRLLEAR